MRIRRNYIRLLLSIIIVTTHSLSAFAGGGSTNYYYAKATATAIPTGAGTVYAENPDNAEGSGTIGAISTAKGVSTQSRGSVIFRFNAYPAENYDFKGWSSTNIVNATPTATDNPYNTSYNASNNDGENNASQNNIYAIFVEKPLFYFSASAVATPEGGGTTSVSPATTNARGEHWNSTSATSTAIAFSATANTGSVFIGWSTTAEGSIVSTDNPYNPTLTSTSTTSGSPTNTTYYARFSTLADPTGINATNITVAQGTTITASNYTLTTAEGNTPYKHVTAESADNSIATVASSGNGFTITGVGIGSTTINIKAYKTDNTTIACYTTFTVIVTPSESGVSGGVVTLNDLEDHSWSYYSDPDCPIRSLNPADVKITYYGDGIVMTGNNDYTASSADFVKPGQTNYTGGAKVNVGGEDENTFVYYKTLERGADTQTAWTFSAGSQSSAASRCPYTPIPNPFQVRPTYGSRGSTDANDFTGWRGFQCWRLKSVSGGAVYSAASGGSALSTGAVINAETEIYFAPNSEYGMEVDFEAVWARAYLIKGNQSGENAILNHGNLGVERNFMTLTSNGQTYKYNGTSGRRITNVGYPVTISCYYPSGEAPDYTTSTVRGNDNNITLGADVKFENVGFYNMGSYTLTANGHNLIVGRGCTGTVNFVRGLNANASSPQYSIRLESGTYNIISLVDGHTNNSNASSITVSGTPKAYLTLGCDYDRAQDVTNGTFSNKLNVNTAVGLGRGPTIGSNAIMNEKTFTFRIKSGTICSSYDMSNYLANFSQSVYISSHGGSTYVGRRTLYIEGGEIAGVAGGMDNQTNNDYLTVDIRMTGGHIRGAIYGGGSQVTAGGTKRIVVTGGTVTGWLGAGANGTSDAGGQTYGKGFVYFGGKAKSGGTGSNNSINGSVGGIIFGAGNGTTASTTSGSMQNGTNVVIADDCEVERDVYGGGNLGYAVEESNVYILGGTVNGGVYGGANQKQGPEINLTMKGGIVKGGVYGGSNTTGVVSGPVTMQIDGGQVGTSSTPANIHGGGYGQPTVITGNVDITLGTSGQTEPGVTVYGDVYGGSALGSVNGTAATTTYHTNVTMNKGVINGSLYGGALGDASNAANVYGPVQVKVYGGSVKKTTASGSGGVYGANNLNGAPQRSVTVDIYGTDLAPSENEYALYAVYGGGNQAAYTYTGYPTVTVHNCGNSIEYVYGGGNAAAVSSTNVTIYGGNKIGNVFGGGNGHDGAANVNGNAQTKIYGGTILNVFGGSNENGLISGTITVDVDEQKESGDGYELCNVNASNVYGGGNLAPYTGNPVVNMKKGTAGDIYGGGLGASAIVTGNTHVSQTGGTSTRIFGGGSQANVTGNVVVDMLSGTANEIYGGGALADTNTAGSGTTKVNLVGGTVKDVYGGGLGQKEGFYGATSSVEAFVNGDVSVLLNGSSVTGATNDCEVKGTIFGCNNLNGTPKGHVTVHIHKTVAKNDDGSVKDKPTKTSNATDDSPGTYELAAVYGGGNMAAYEPTSAAEKTEVIIDGCDLSSIKYVYGGGNAASVPATLVTINGSYEIYQVFGGGNGKDALPDGSANPGANVGYKADGTTGYGAGTATVDINGGTIHSAFGGSNTLGNVRTKAEVHLDEAKDGSGNPICPLKIDEVYGGGNEAFMAGGGEIVLGCITYMKEIYGGAKNADVGSNINLTITSGHFDRVFGGNNLGGCIKGSITVNIEETGCNPITIGELYGCGNQAAYSIYGYKQVTENGEQVWKPRESDSDGGTGPDTPYGNPTLNIKSFTSIGRIFGGGYGEPAKVVGNPTVNINEVVGANASTASQYAGTQVKINEGEANEYTVTLPAHNTGIGAIGTVFGGGNAAKVIGNTNVNIGTLSTITYVSGTDHTDKTVLGVDIRENVFGGGNQADVTGNTNVVVGK